MSPNWCLFQEHLWLQFRLLLSFWNIQRLLNLCSAGLRLLNTSVHSAHTSQTFLKHYLADITLFLKNLKNLYSPNKIKFQLLGSLTIQLRLSFQWNLLLLPSILPGPLASPWICLQSGHLLLPHPQCLPFSLSKSSLLFQVCSPLVFFTPTGSALPFLNYFGGSDHL